MACGRSVENDPKSNEKEGSEDALTLVQLIALQAQILHTKEAAFKN
jgi:hypothetical protein